MRVKISLTDTLGSVQNWAQNASSPASKACENQCIVKLNSHQIRYINKRTANFNSCLFRHLHTVFFVVSCTTAFLKASFVSVFPISLMFDASHSKKYHKTFQSHSKPLTNHKFAAINIQVVRSYDKVRFQTKTFRKSSNARWQMYVETQNTQILISAPTIPRIVQKGKTADIKAW